MSENNITPSGPSDNKLGDILGKVNAGGRATSTFQDLWDLGYARLIPVIPPHAPISSRSYLHKQLQVGKDPRGKVPGYVNGDGGWTAMQGWTSHRATGADLRSWHHMGASTGMVLGRGLAALDIDALDEATADRIEKDALELLGPAPMRVGKWPKRLLLYAITEDLRYRCTAFHAGDRTDRVELLTKGKQAVVAGIHPVTDRPYEWRRALVPRSRLATVSAQQLDAFFDRIGAYLPAASTSPGGLVKDRSTIDQAALRGDLRMIASAVRAIPNSHRHFNYDAWVTIAIALRGACANDEDLGLSLFVEFSERSDIAEPTEDPERVYWSSRPPFSIPAEYLYHLAEKHGGWTGRREKWFEPSSEPAFEDDERPDKTPSPTIKATQFNLPDPAAIPRRRWLYGDHYIRQFVSATIAPGGLGKSSLIIAEALAMVSGKPLLGIEPRGLSRVWYWNGEDPRDELVRRVAATMLHYGLTNEDIGDRFFLDSGRDVGIVIARRSRDEAVIAEPVSEQLIGELRSRHFDVLIIDPFVSSHRVPENDNGAIDLVSKEWGRIAGVTNCSVGLVHHVRKTNGADITVEDSRGASALVSTTRAARALNRMTEQEAKTLGLEAIRRSFFRFSDAKNNMAPSPAGSKTEWMRLVSHALGNGEGAPAEALMTGDHVGVVTRFECTDGALPYEGSEIRKALDALRSGEWRYNVQCRDAWAGVPIAIALGLDPESDRARLKTLLKQLLAAQKIRLASKKDGSRKTRTFVEVVPESVFE